MMSNFAYNMSAFATKSYAVISRHIEIVAKPNLLSIQIWVYDEGIIFRKMFTKRAGYNCVE